MDKTAPIRRFELSGSDGEMASHPNGDWVSFEDIERYLPHEGNDLPKNEVTVLAKVVSEGDERGSWYYCVSLDEGGGTAWIRRDMKNLDLSKVIAWMHAP